MRGFLVCSLMVLAACGDVVDVDGDASNNNGNDGDALVDAPVFDANGSIADANAAPADAPLPDADPNACSGEGTPCGAISQCGAPGACGGFAGTCGQDGTQTRECVDFTCQSGTCTAGAPFDDEVACTRNTSGIACGSSTSCGSCVQDSGSICVETGTRACTTTNRVCSAGICQTDSTSPSTQSCAVATNGDTCSFTNAGCIGFALRPVCCSSGVCNQSCGACEL